MSADAKIWNDSDNDREPNWKGLHDGPCQWDAAYHREPQYLLTDVIEDIETCLRARLRWVFRQYPDDQVGLSGWCV